MPEVSKKITGSLEVPQSLESEIEKKSDNLPIFKKNFETFSEKGVTKLLEFLFAGAINLEASDIHIEPEEEKVKIRARLDGNLQDVTFANKKIYEEILSRIKLLSGLKFNVSDRPQDGRFSVLWKGVEIEIRTSTIPAEYGESIVMRLLDPKSLISIEDLGLRKDLLEKFNHEIKKPNGMIIITGPTGSGKTTTLYAFLKKIYSSKIKIITIEDPIEYKLEGVSQTQTDPEKGYDFANGLKSIMRQDPDVILVGEIRDLKTADIALQAALTGHLVLTTLHTNDAAGIIVRLVSLGASLANIGPAVNMSVAQRLVRKICEKCGQMAEMTNEEMEKIKKGLKSVPKNVIVPQFDSKTKLARPKGCQECNFTGYRGRTGIFETFLVDDEMENFILTSPSIASMRLRAIKQGMVTMHQDGLIKVLQGVTTLEEVEKVTGE